MLLSETDDERRKSSNVLVLNVQNLRQKNNRLYLLFNVANT